MNTNHHNRGVAGRATALLAIASMAVLASLLAAMLPPQRAWSAASGGSANISAKAGSSGVTKGLFVTLSSDGVIATASSPSDAVVGVCRKTAAANKTTSYAPVGAQTTVTSGEATTAGDLLTAGTGGKAFVLDAADSLTQRIAAMALTSAIGANRDVDVIVAAAVQQGLVPQLTFEAADNEDGTGMVAIQAVDAAGNDLAGRFRVRTWLSTSDLGAPVADTDFSVHTGTQLREITANADYEVISEMAGYVWMGIDVAVDGTYYVMAEVDGRIYSGSVTITGN